MNLYIKISKVDLNQNNKKFLECVQHNSQNSYIKNIFIYTDCKEYRTTIRNVKIIFKDKLADYFIMSQSKFTKGTIIYSNPFIKFGEDLFKISENELNKYILVNKDYKIYLNDVKIIQNDGEIQFINKEEKSIRLSCLNTSIMSVTNDSQSIIKKPTVRTTPTKRSKKLDVIIVSVDYNDLLILTLQKNRKIFHNITVVTSKTDQKCKEICDKFGVSCIQTDIMYDNNSTFNKGKAINVGINSIENPDLILLLDADIIVENDINLHDLNDKYLYTSERIILPNYDSYLDYINNGVYNKLDRDQGLGFYQLFSINNNSINRNNPYPDNSSDASWSDLEFRNKFEFKKNIDRVIHLGDTCKNWKGRITEEFISEEILNQILEQNEFNINIYFDKIYCLNLDRRQDRWKKASEQFNRFNINVERWSAIDGDSLDNKLLDYYNPDGLKGEEASILGIPENKNAIGCLLSHLEIIKNAKENNYNRILIFEDDILLSDNFNEEVKKIENIDWNLLYLGASQFDWGGIDTSRKYYRCNKTLGTFAYAVDETIYDEIIESFENNKKSIDNLLTLIQEKCNKECYTFSPNIVISDVEDSNIRKSNEMIEYSKKVKWDLDKFSIISYFEKIKSTTIIIPCYGHSKYLEECIDSCLSQSIKTGKILVLLMDEDSILMKSKIENKSNIIKCIISRKMKLSEARNFCAEEIETKYFIPLDADDKIPENFIEEICKIESDVVYIGSEYFGSQSGFWPDPITEEINWTKLTTFRRNSLVCTALIKKESFIKSGKYNGSLWAFEDMDLWIRMYKNNFIFKKCFNTKLLYRKHPSSGSLLSQANSNEEHRKELKKIIMCDDFYKRTPKIIHWVWIGNNPIPEEVVKTWKKNLPEGEWKYMLWNENNFDMNSCEFLKKAYDSKKYGICVDYIRAKVLYEYGGVWLDADCLITNDISPFLQYDFFGSWENINYLNIGLIGCSSKLDIIKEILDYYTNINIGDDVIETHHRFVNEIGTGPMVLTKELMKIKNIRNGGFTNDFIFNKKKYLIETPEIFVLDDSNSGKINYAIHLFDGSWTDKKEEWSVVVRTSYDNWKNKNKI